MTDAVRQPPWFDEKNAVELPEGYEWSPQEQWAWARLLRGAEADMRMFDPALPRENFAAWYAGRDDGAGDNANAVDAAGALSAWPAKRTLRDTFLRQVLFREPHAKASSHAWVRIRAAVIEESLSWVAGNFGGELWLDACRFMKPVHWQGLRIDGLLSLHGSRFEAGLFADRLTTSGGFFCRGGFTAKGEVRLLGAKIGGDLDFLDASLENGLKADGSETSGFLFCNGSFTSSGEVRLVGAKAGRGVVLIGATLKENLDASNSRVGGSLYLRDTTLADADFVGTHVDGNVQLGGSTIDGVVDFTGARISGELQTTQSETGPGWGEGARLVLRNARLGALAGGAGSFPLKAAKDGRPAMDLAGLSYERLGGLNAATGGSLAKDSVKNLKRWLAAGHTRSDYAPGPYRTLANALVGAGQTREANHILRAMRASEAHCEKSWLRKAGFFLSNLFIGYGYLSWRAFAWFFVIVGAWTAIGLRLDGLTAVAPTREGFEEFFRWLGFSFGNAIPLVSLDKAHESFLAARFAPTGDPKDVPVAIAWAYYAQKVLGFVILSYLAAGVTGLARRQQD